MIRKTVLATIALSVMLCAPVQAAKVSEEMVKETIIKQSLEMNVDPALALSIAKKESGFKHELRSSHGAVGVFQLLPSTAKRLGYNPYHLSDNIKAGLTYYKMMYKMFGSTELALAAYNAGPGNVKRCGGQIPPYAETRRFVNVIMQDYNNQKKNPDPAIARVKSQRQLNLPENESNFIEAPKDFEFPCLNEIPEFKNSDPVMEIL